MLELGNIRLSCSNTASPLHVVPINLHLRVKLYRYPIPRDYDLTTIIQGKAFSQSWV